MWMPCWGYPGLCACLMPQAPNTESLQQQYNLSRRLPSRALQAPLRHTATTCMLWTQWRMVPRLPVWQPKTGNRPSWQTSSWCRWLQRYGTGPWPSACTSQLTCESSSSSFGNANHLKLRQGILYRKVLPKGSQDHEALFQFVRPATHRKTTLEGYHDEIGHLGLERMFNLMCNHFFWPQMAVQAKEHVEKCQWCITFKQKQQKAPMESIVNTHPLKLVYIDYLCLEPGKGKENVPVVTNHFTWHAQTYITQAQMAKTMAKVLWYNFIVHYGLPSKITPYHTFFVTKELLVNCQHPYLCLD